MDLEIVIGKFENQTLQLQLLTIMYLLKIDIYLLLIKYQEHKLSILIEMLKNLVLLIME